MAKAANFLCRNTWQDIGWTNTKQQVLEEVDDGRVRMFGRYIYLHIALSIIFWFILLKDLGAAWVVPETLQSCSGQITHLLATEGGRLLQNAAIMA